MDHKYTQLMTAKFECDLEYGWALTAAAGYLLKAKGAYRGPMTEGFVICSSLILKRLNEESAEETQALRSL